MLFVFIHAFADFAGPCYGLCVVCCMLRGGHLGTFCCHVGAMLGGLILGPFWEGAISGGFGAASVYFWASSLRGAGRIPIAMALELDKQQRPGPGLQMPVGQEAWRFFSLLYYLLMSLLFQAQLPLAAVDDVVLAVAVFLSWRCSCCCSCCCCCCRCLLQML